MKNNEEILNQVNLIKSKFKAESVTKKDIENQKISFLEMLNKLIRTILDDKDISVYDVLSKENIENWNNANNSFSYRAKSFIVNNSKNFLYLTLLTTITGFLVSEAIDFYAVDGITTGTYIKAILTELCFIFLSGYRTTSLAEKISVGFLRVGIFCLMLFAITSQTLLDGKTDIGNINSISEQISIYEKQIVEKEENIRYYRDVKKWSNTTKQLLKEKDELVKELLSLKKQQASGSNQEVSKLVEYRMYGRAFFRILLLFISVLITRRLFKF